MLPLGQVSGLRVENSPTLGAQLMGITQPNRIEPELPEQESIRHHVYFLDLGNLEKQLQTLTEEVRGLRADLAARTIEARLRSLWSTIRAWLATLRRR